MRPTDLTFVRNIIDYTTREGVAIMCWICDNRNEPHPRCYECGEELCLNVEEDDRIERGYQVDVRFYCKSCLFADEVVVL